MDEGARQTAERVSAHLASVLPAVEGVCLYGSVARGDAREGSDIDLLVLGSDQELTVAELRRHLPRSMQGSEVSVAYHTPESLSRYLQRWSRFGVHLKTEGTILFDRHGRLREALDADSPVSTRDELRLQLLHLKPYEQLERFGGRFLFPLAHMYSVGRTVTFALLAEQGVFEFNHQNAFEQLADRLPDRSTDIERIAELRPFAELVRGHGGERLPFSFEGSATQVSAAREAIVRLVSLSEHADELAAS